MNNELCIEVNHTHLFQRKIDDKFGWMGLLEVSDTNRLNFNNHLILIVNNDKVYIAETPDFLQKHIDDNVGNYEKENRVNFSVVEWITSNQWMDLNIPTSEEQLLLAKAFQIDSRQMIIFGVSSHPVVEYTINDQETWYRLTDMGLTEENNPYIESTKGTDFNNLLRKPIWMNKDKELFSLSSIPNSLLNDYKKLYQRIKENDFKPIDKDKVKDLSDFEKKELSKHVMFDSSYYQYLRKMDKCDVDEYEMMTPKASIERRERFAKIAIRSIRENEKDELSNN